MLQHYGALHRRIETGETEGMIELSYTITALMTYEQRIRDAPEWPYTAETLRSLSVSIVVPVITWLYQIFSDQLFG